MKSDTERKRFHKEKIHRKRNRLHVHLSKDLRGKLKTKKRAVLVRRNDRVKIMRGPEKGKEARVSRVDVVKRKVFLEGIVTKTAKGKEVLLPLEPSNLLLVSLGPTEERKKIFKEEAFRKPEQKKPEAAPKAEGVHKPHEAKEHEHEKHELAKMPEPKHTSHPAHPGAEQKKS